MKRALEKFLLLPLLLATGAGAADLRVDFTPQFDGKLLAFDELKNQIASGQKISVTRLDFLVSDFALRETNGIWIGQKNYFAFVNARDGKTNFLLENIPPGNYDAIHFQIGLPPEINHGDVTQWPAGHPLNPDVNGLYWGWSHEYVFLALEGGWQNSGKLSGFSFHLATDSKLMTVELPVALDLNSSRQIQVTLDVGKIFSAPNKIVLSDKSDTTHSRTNDMLAGQLRQNVENAFAVESVKGYSPIAELPHGTNDIEIAPDATPYRLTISRFVPQPDLPRDNPLTVEGVSLGGRLFFDRRLSADNSESCATCHNPRSAFSQPRRFSRGADGDIGVRNAMALPGKVRSSGTVARQHCANRFCNRSKIRLKCTNRFQPPSPKFQQTRIITGFLRMPLARRKLLWIKLRARWSNF